LWGLGQRNFEFGNVLTWFVCVIEFELKDWEKKTSQLQKSLSENPK
jgi:hypothetical protein